MSQCNQFVLRNDLTKSLRLCIEPEGALFPLERGEEVSIIDRFTHAPVTVKLSTSEAGDPVLSIWPGDGEVRVEKNGVDVLDLLQDSSR